MTVLEGAGPLRTFLSVSIGMYTTVIWICGGAQHQLEQGELLAALIPLSGTVLVTLPVFHMCGLGQSRSLKLIWTMDCSGLSCLLSRVLFLPHD